MHAITTLALALPLLAAATPVELDARTGGGSCNTGPVQCCNSLMESSTTNLSQLSSLLGISLPNIGALIGLTCNPISVLGVGGNSCSSQPVCCTGNTFGGLINLGCTPINVNL